MVVAGDLVIVGNDGLTGSIYAFDRRSGDVRWKYDAGANGAGLDLLLAGTRVCTVTSDEGLIALDVTTGRLAWRYSVKPASYASPATDGKRIYVAAVDGVVHAVSADNGSLVWKRQLAGTPSNTIIAKSGSLYVGTSSTGWDDPWDVSGRGTHALHRLDAARGEMLGSLKLPAKPLGQGAVAGKIIVLFAGGDLLAADQNLTRIRWRIAAPTQNQNPRLQVRGDTAYIGVNPRQFMAVNIHDGSIRSRHPAEGMITTFLVDDQMIVLGANQKLWAYRAGK